MQTARRIQTLPPYLFAEIDRKIAERKAAGADVISLGIGDPDRPTPAHVVEALKKAVQDVSTHQYPSYVGMPEFRRSVAAWYERRFSVTLDPDTQVLPLIGSKEGIANLSTAFVDPGDLVAVPDPAYPVYEIGAHLHNGTAYEMPLLAAHDFLPDFLQILPKQLTRTKILWLNYPSNPTAAVATAEFFAEAVAFAKKHDLLVVNDAAYSEIAFDGYQHPSILQAPGALDTAVEFHSLSKTYNMTGWRIGWMAGCAEAVEALGRVKTNIDSGIFNAVQMAGIAALEGPQDCVAEMVQLYQSRRDRVCSVFEENGWKFTRPKASVFVWLPVPEGRTSLSTADLLLQKADVVVTPGSGYGPAGEGYIRLSLTVPDDRLDIAVSRMGKALANT